MDLNRTERSVLPFLILFVVVMIFGTTGIVRCQMRRQASSAKPTVAAKKVRVSCTYTRPTQSPTGTIDMWYVVAENGERVKKPVCHRDVVNTLACEREVPDVSFTGLVVEYNYGEERVMSECVEEKIHGRLTCTADGKPISALQSPLSTPLYGGCHFKLIPK